MRSPLLMLLVLATAPGAAAFAQGRLPVTVQHADGSSTLPRDPQRVVVMDEEALGWMYALGLGHRVVGFASAMVGPTDLQAGRLKSETIRNSFYRRGNVAAARYVGNWTEPSLEAIAALRPDVIVRLTWEGNTNYAQLSRIAPTIGFREDREGFWQRDLRELGRVFGREDRADEAIRRVNAAHALARSQLTAAGVFRRFPKVVVVSPFAGGQNYVYTRVRLIEDLRAMGFQDGVNPAMASTLGIGAVISDEALLSLPSDTLVVLFPPGGEYNGAQAFLNSAVGQRLRDRTVTFELERYSPWSGPLVSLRNTQELTRLIAARVRP